MCPFRADNRMIQNISTRPFQSCSWPLSVKYDSHECVTSTVCTKHGTHMNEIMSHVWKRKVTHINELCITCVSRCRDQRISWFAPANVSRDTHMNTPPIWMTPRIWMTPGDICRHILREESAALSVFICDEQHKYEWPRPYLWTSHPAHTT